MADMQPDITIREATPDDAETLASLLAEMDADAQAPMDPSAVRQIMAQMRAYPEFRAYLAIDGTGTPLGTFSLMVLTSLSHRGARHALLEAVVVTRARRGQGVGRAMLQQALRMARSAGCYKLALSSNLKRSNAHRFYEQLGFRQHGVSFSIS